MPPIIDARDVRVNHTTDASIVATQLSYSLPDGRALLHDLTISFGRERTGLIGPNGSDDRLQAMRRMDAGGATMSDLELVGDDWDLAERAAATLARFGLGHLSLDRPVGAVSGGEATRVALAGLALGRPDFLLLDEPTNHLDAVSRDAVYSFVAGWSGGLLCVSHDRGLLRLMDRTVELSSLGVHSYGGGYDFYRARRDADAAAADREMASAAAALRLAERDAR